MNERIYVFALCLMEGHFQKQVFSWLQVIDHNNYCHTIGAFRFLRRL